MEESGGGRPAGTGASDGGGSSLGEEGLDLGDSDSCADRGEVWASLGDGEVFTGAGKACDEVSEDGGGCFTMASGGGAREGGGKLIARGGGAREGGGRLNSGSFFAGAGEVVFAAVGGTGLVLAVPGVGPGGGIVGGKEGGVDDTVDVAVVDVLEESGGGGSGNFGSEGGAAEEPFSESLSSLSSLSSSGPSSSLPGSCSLPVVCSSLFTTNTSVCTNITIQVHIRSHIQRQKMGDKVVRVGAR